MYRRRGLFRNLQAFFKNNPVIKLEQCSELIVLVVFSKPDPVKQNSMGLILKEGYLGIYLQLPTLPEGRQSGECYTDNSNKVYQHLYFNVSLFEYVA